MVIEFELQGSKCLHKGIFDTTGFWLKFEPQLEDDMSAGGGKFIDGWKIYSHFSFSYFHEDKAKADAVYKAIVQCFRSGSNIDLEGIGYIRRVSK